MKVLALSATESVVGGKHVTWEPGYYSVVYDAYGMPWEVYNEGYYREVSDAEEFVDMLALGIIGVVFLGVFIAAVTR